MSEDSDRQDIVNDRDNYDRLIAVIEANQGILGLSIVSCEPGVFQDFLIDRYEKELAPKIRSYRIKLDESEPSLLSPLEELFANTPELSIDRVPAVITVIGVADLLTIPLRETETKSPVDKFFGYLQWTREGLRKFPYPIVIFLPPKILEKISIAAPDFWSWRNDVFRFTSSLKPLIESKSESMIKIEEVREYNPLVRKRHYFSLEQQLSQCEIEEPEVREYRSFTGRFFPKLINSKKHDILPLEELLQQLNLVSPGENLNNISPSLAYLYDRLGQAYASRIMSKKCDDLERETIVAIDYFKKAIEIQTKLNLETDRANTLVRMGELYRDIGNYKSAIEVTKRALLTFRKVADRLSEASALVAMGDIYQKYHIEEHIELAIEAYYKSLEVYNREEFPEEWGRVQNNLAAAFSQRIAGDKAENIERAIEAYYKSLELYTREEFPEQYAEIQNNLAIAYRQRIRGDRAENRKRADEADSNSRSNVL